jgi:hypothetical protein
VAAANPASALNSKRERMSDGKGAASGATDEASSNRAQAGAGAATVVGELIDATRAAIAAVADEQKERAADRIAAVSEAVRHAGQSLDPAATPIIAGYLSQTAGQIDAVADTIRDRSWSELAADAADFARRQPALFLAATVALGFLAGRLLSTSTGDAAQHGFNPPEPVASTPEPTGLPAGGDSKVAGGLGVDVTSAREAD